jgi:hypothetical protein
MSEEWRLWKFPGVYAIKHVADGKIYIGQSVNMSKRILYHKCSDKDCIHLYRALACYGWDAFEVVVLEKVNDPAQLNEREQYWMDTLESHNPQKGYNIRRTIDGKIRQPRTGGCTEGTYTYTIRIPPEIAEKLRDLAEREHRSLNAQIIVSIEMAVAQGETEA